LRLHINNSRPINDPWSFHCMIATLCCKTISHETPSAYSLHYMHLMSPTQVSRSSTCCLWKIFHVFDRGPRAISLVSQQFYCLEIETQPPEETTLI
jgi:hypothetical protein